MPETTSTQALYLLLGGYLNQDWSDDYPDVWEAVTDFLRSEPRLASQLPGEIETLLGTATSEAELRRSVVDELGSGYAPEGDGLTYRGWLLEVARRAIHTESA